MKDTVISINSFFKIFDNCICENFLFLNNIKTFRGQFLFELFLFFFFF